MARLKQDSMKPARSTKYQVGPGTYVTLAYEAFDGDGELVDGTEENAPARFVCGYGLLLPALERALEGMTAGQERSVVLRPAEAYGPRRPDAVLEVDRGEFPDEVAAGDRYELENEAGGILVLRVLDVDDSRIVLDTNHPLAGQNVRFEVRVLDVRPATSDETAQAEARLSSEGEPTAAAPLGLLPPERLIRDPRRRYEKHRKPNGETR
jgi:FKBP-type peptidyl-prolyl cis-trans isomerase SlyD